MILTLRYRSLEVDDGNSTIKLVDAQGAEVLGDAGNLQLQDKNGQILSSSAQRDIQQNGQKAAVGTYDYRLTSGVNNDGLYIGYGLTQLDLHATDSDALVLSSNGKSENAADLSAKITGSGDWHSAARRVRPYRFLTKTTTIPVLPICAVGRFC